MQLLGPIGGADCKHLSGFLVTIGSPTTRNTTFFLHKGRAQINTEIDIWDLLIFPLKGLGLPRAQ